MLLQQCCAYAGQLFAVVLSAVEYAVHTSVYVSYYNVTVGQYTALEITCSRQSCEDQKHVRICVK